MKFVVEQARGEVSMSELCRRFGVSRKTGYKWLARYRAAGAAGLVDRSRAPHRVAHGMSSEVAEAVLSVRRAHPTWGPRKVRAWLVRHDGGVSWPAASTIGDLLRREGLVVARRRRWRTPPRSRPFAHCEAPNDVWCADFKGWFCTGDGARCEPFTLSDADSRYLLRCQAVARTDADHVWPIFEAAFREYGLPLVVRSDNGPPFASVAAGGLAPLSVKLIKAGVMVERIDPGKPSQNGRHERLHLTLKQDTACPPARDLRAQAERFVAFRRVYNEERPHEALDMAVPGERYAPSPRRYSGRLESPDYPSDHVVRRVKRSGEISWRGVHIHISQSLAGEPVGLWESDEGVWRVSFGPIELGTIDHRETLLRAGARARAAAKR
jgi:transposase InsO family protein